MPPRKAPDPPCGNPILLGFLEEWLEQAKSANSKNAFTWKRAYQSMKACPLTFQHPSEAEQLSGLGPKICERLTKEYEKYCQNNGLSMPEMPGPRRGEASTGRKNSATATGGDDIAGPTAKRRKTNAATTGTTQKRLRAKPGNMRGLGLCIDDEDEDSDDGGRRSANRGSYGDSQANNQRNTRGSVGLAPSPDREEDSGSEAVVSRTANAIRNNRRRLENIYSGPVREYGQRRLIDEPVLANVAPNIQARNQRRYPNSPPLKEPAQSQFRPRDQINRPFQSHTQDEPPARPRSQSQISRPFHDGSPDEVPGRPRPRPELQTDRPFHTALPAERPPSTLFPAMSNSTSIHRAPISCSISSAPAPAPVPASAPRTATVSSRTASASISVPANAEPAVSNTFPDFNPIRFLAGTYTINLLLDNREVRSKTDRDYLQDHLGNRGVPPAVRPLPVGDMLWIARTTTEPSQEIVLNHIVERKRLDDLLNSIKDGRFHEQKFRLQKCGIGNVVYIIEHKQIGEIEPHTQDAIDTAIASTQVVNGFFVKKTAKMDDTIRYLVRYTKMLQKLLEGKDLFVVPDEVVDVDSYYTAMGELRNRDKNKEWGVSYKAFASVMGKSSALRLKDVFLKMLMCTRGVSAEKAMEIQKAFGTPKELVEAYEKCQSEEERRNLVATMCDEGQMNRRRKIGKAVSGKISAVWAGGGDEEEDE